MYFLNSIEAIELFNANPRTYLMPPMPCSPVRYFVIGHPLAGKTVFAHQLALACHAIVIDMKDELCARVDQVKKDYLYKRKLQYTLEARQLVDKECHAQWKKTERARRKDLHEWVAVS